jgi:YesN/AraC family two-component response regulator
MSKVLIIEDSKMYRQILRETLQFRFPKIEILEAGDGAEALAKLSDSPPDLIFMDIKLPGETGLELTKKIKMQNPSSTIIILTSYDLPEYREAASQYKVSHFLAKGATTRNQIIKLIESILPEQDTHANIA